MVKVYRQGDVILVSADDVNIYDGWMEDDMLIIRSETGNAHVLEMPVYRYAGALYVDVKRQSVMKHPEHPPLRIEPGKYRVLTVRDYFLNNITD